MLNSVILLIFPMCMAFAAAYDLLTMRIPNWLVLVTALGFVVAALAAGFPLEEWGMHLATGFGVLVITFVLFSFGWIGGGDAKFAAATALWMGWPMTLPYLAYAGILGGVLTLLLLGVRRFPLPVGLIRIEWIARLHDPKTGVPYGIALAAAALLLFPQLPIFKALGL
ncbi:A24 family peptidase [Cucumibacter marinus]|uniref:A24 family peptidase n=1 Tax=Cucumibacter marinus TaxID=1121252 RepID=UPI0003FE7D13|nr:prepilin peptidase [Cucumibacter marinus]